MNIEFLRNADRVRLYDKSANLLYDSAESAESPVDAARRLAAVTIARDIVELLCVAERKGYRWSGRLRIFDGAIEPRDETEYLKHILNCPQNPLLVEASTVVIPAAVLE